MHHACHGICTIKQVNCFILITCMQPIHNQPSSCLHVAMLFYILFVCHENTLLSARLQFVTIHAIYAYCAYCLLPTRISGNQFLQYSTTSTVNHLLLSKLLVSYVCERLIVFNSICTINIYHSIVLIPKLRTSTQASQGMQLEFCSSKTNPFKQQ